MPTGLKWHNTRKNIHTLQSPAPISFLQPRKKYTKAVKILLFTIFIYGRMFSNFSIGAEDAVKKLAHT